MILMFAIVNILIVSRAKFINFQGSLATHKSLHYHLEEDFWEIQALVAMVG